MAADLGWFKSGGKDFAPLVDEESGLIPTPPKPSNLRTGTMVNRDASLKAFLAKFSRVKNEVAELQRKFKHLNDTYEDSFGAATPEEIKTFKADLESSMNEIKGATQRLLNDVKSLQQDIDHADMDKQLLRLQKDKTSELEGELRQFCEKVYAFQSRMKDDRMAEYRSKLKTHFNRDFSDAEVQKWADNPDDNALWSMMLHDQGRPDAQKVLNEIQERNRAAKALQTSIEEVYRLFQDMQILVQKQGEQIRSLTDKLEKTEDYVSTAVNKVHGAVTLKATRKRTKLLIMVAIAVLIAVIVAVILGTVFGVQPVK